MRARILWAVVLLTLLAGIGSAQRTVKPALHGRHWVAITGKPLGATAGAMIFQKGGNAVDAAVAKIPPETYAKEHEELGRALLRFHGDWWPSLGGCLRRLDDCLPDLDDAERRLAEGDRLEIVTLVGGG